MCIEPLRNHDGGALRFGDGVSVQRRGELHRVRSRARANLGASALGVLLPAPCFRQGDKWVRLLDMAQEGALALFARDLHGVANLIRASVELFHVSVLKLAVKHRQLGGFDNSNKSVLTTCVV